MKETDSTGTLPDLGPVSYGQWRASELGAITERLEHELVLKLVGDVRHCRVLDIGCGDGEFAFELTRRGATVMGIDASSEMIAAAKARVHREDVDGTFQVATAQQIPFANEQFDVVTAITILCFVDDPVPVFQEIARVLRPGGRLVIGELGKWSTWAVGRRIRALFGSRLWRLGRFRTAGELRRLAEGVGLTVKTVRGAIYYPRLAIIARAMIGLDAWLGQLTTFGAAFAALAAVKRDRRL